MDEITDRIIEGECKKAIEMTLGEEIIGRHKIIEVRIMEVDVEMITDTCTETILEMTIETKILEEAEVGL